MANTISQITTVPVPTAKEWVDNWRNRKDTEFDLKGFWIPEADMTGILSEPGVENIRGYFGIDGQGEYKMLFVGVDIDGNDLIDPEAGYYIYDFTQPCPPMCSETGPLK